MNTVSHTALTASDGVPWASPPVDKILNKPEIERITGRCSETIRRWELAGKFPARIKLNPDGRSVGWLASEVAAWLAARAAARDPV